MEEKIPLLELSHISKSFGKNIVLHDISFSLKEGEIIGLVGENGAGKSTLMKILVSMPEIHETGGYEGQVFYRGNEVHFLTPSDSLEAGIGSVHQEFSLIPGFTATENIFINREPTRSNFFSFLFNDTLKTLDRKMMKNRAKKAIKTLGVPLREDMPVNVMSVGFRQFTEIAREIEKESTQLLILDEPTAVLTESEAESLVLAAKALAAKGISIIFISHRLNEILSLCDTVLVLRDGEITLKKPTDEITVKEISHAMVGRNIEERESSSSDGKGEEVLQIKNLWVNMPGELVRRATFSVKKGEIFGLAGLAGQGKLGIPSGLMGVSPADGEVFYEGKPLPLNDPGEIQKRGIAFVSEDRAGLGLLLEESIANNIVLPAIVVQKRFYRSIGGIPFLDRRAIKESALKMVEELSIRCTGIHQRVRELSGGNQQKVCLAKAFLLNPKLLFVSEPTRGIDVGAKAIVLQRLQRYREEAEATIVICSSELEELRSICDRIAVVNEGVIVDILSATESIDVFGEKMLEEVKRETQGKRQKDNPKDKQEKKQGEENDS